MIVLNGKEYNVVFLDTNIMRLIARNTNGAGKDFFIKFFVESKLNVPSFSIHNIFELKNYQDFYDDFIEIFNNIPCLVFFPYKSILNFEVDCFKNGVVPTICNQVVYATSPRDTENQPSLEKYLNKLWSDSVFTTLLRENIKELTSIAKAWEEQRTDIVDLKSIPGLPVNKFTPKYYKYFEENTIIKDFMNHNFKLNNIDYRKFPSIRVMEYSHFSRVHLTKKKIESNDVMDVKISSAMPYVDIVIIEKFQIDVLKKASNFIEYLDVKEFYNTRDFESKSNA